MKKRGKLILIFVLAALSLFVSASAVEITVKVNPNAEVTLNVLNTLTLEAYQTFILNSSDSGIVAATFTPSVGSVAISLIVRRDGKIVQSVKASDYGDFATSSPIYIDTLQEKEPEVNESLASAENLTAAETADVNETEISPAASPAAEENSSISDSVVTGSVVSDSGSSSGIFASLGAIAKKSYIYAIYVLVIAVVLAVLFVGIRFAGRRRNNAAAPSGRWPAGAADYSSPEILDAESKIKHAQEELLKAREEINYLKNKKAMVATAEKKFKDAKAELDRLKES